MSANTYKIGDRVVALGSTSDVATVWGDLGTIESLDLEGNGADIRWDRAVPLVHALDDLDPYTDHHWYADFIEIRPATWWDEVEAFFAKLWDKVTFRG